MSYDLSVYAATPLGFEGLLALVRGTAGLDVDGSPSSDAQSLVVVRGRRRAYCFTVDGPFEVESDDVPEEVTASVTGAKAVYRVSVEGSEEVSIQHAIRFARKLAKVTAGALLDDKSGDVWPKPKANRVAAPSRERITDCIDLVFYFLNEDVPDNLPQIILHTARKYLPEALPRRFGTTHPYKGKLDRDGDQGFVDACARATLYGLFFAGVYPVVGGYYGAGMRQTVGKLSLSLDKAVLRDPKWRDALHAFFIAFATESRSFFASAEVLRGRKFDGRVFWVLSGSENGTSGEFQGIWKGLQPYPHWWTWFGPDYLQFVAPYLKGNTEMRGDHMFHSWSEEPLNRDQITAILPDPARPWIPVDFQAGRGPDGIPEKAAKIMPPRLMPDLEHG